METTLDMRNAKSVQIVLDRRLTNGYTDIPARPHKKRRICKKWIKRYGYRPNVDMNIYFTQDAAIMHPKIFERLKKICESEEKAVEALVKVKEQKEKEGNDHRAMEKS